MKYLYIALLLMFSQTASAQHTCIMIGDSMMSFAGVDTVGGVSPHSDKMAAASARGAARRGESKVQAAKLQQILNAGHWVEYEE